MINTIGGFFGRMFGTDKAIEKSIDLVGSGLDKIWYTDEEKAQDAAKDRAAARGILIEWVDKSQGQNIARRFLAVIITLTWLCMYLLEASLHMAAVWLAQGDSAAMLNASAQLIGERAMEMNGAMMLILGFYFAAPHLGRIVGPAMERFGGKTQK